MTQNPTAATSFVRATAEGSADEILAALDESQLRSLAVELAQLLASTSPALHTVPGEPEPEQIYGHATRLAAATLGVPPDQLTARVRRRPVADARAVAQTALRRCGLSLPAIGSHFGQHHTTVLHSLSKVEASPRLRAAAEQIAAQLLAPEAAAS
ncbi:helix-turn-helix domain-containing protein [Nocardioides sp.]|uniref:helix-turn-helix domain-containing protein n=1 Tax=Nocardioides sp. TaxID=35761 RepID=UPI0027357BA9|nr:helix-turn-helix domain-containing protein [Nocardioides sp.]MDP3889845.1 helix-turn-helix domain-containing protein [Nocardioides sp.]